MHKKQKQSLAGIGAVGAAALLLSGCGGSSFQKNTFSNYPNTLPAAFGIEPVAASGNLQITPLFFETSGLGSADGSTAYLTAATDFAVVTNANNAALNLNVDPNSTGKVPLGFSAGGSYIDGSAGTAAPVSAVAPGTSVLFRAAIANGVANNNASQIGTTTLTSTDAQWTLGTLPMTFNNPGKGGPLANGTYVTGTGGNPVPFTLPFTTSGLHTVAVTVSDADGRVTTTTFGIPVVTSTTVALLAQNITPDPTTATPKPAAAAITPGDTVTIDGGAGLGTYPTGYTPTVADAQGSVLFFVAPGTHTLTETSVVPATATVPATTKTTTQTIVISAAAAGTTIIQ